MFCVFLYTFSCLVYVKCVLLFLFIHLYKCSITVWLHSNLSEKPASPLGGGGVDALSLCVFGLVFDSMACPAPLCLYF